MSEQYLVSARKYRPQTFDTVVGQSHITTTLKNAIRNQHVAHAFLFCGPRGVGKTTCARILAKTINCEHPTADMEACGECNTCKTFNDNASFSVFELDAASNNSVEDIRALNEQVRFAPQIGKYKVYIIDEVHMLSASAFNAFLKTLEEPPPYAIFILATTEKHKILPTILSRCQIFDFKRIQSSDIVAHLNSICVKEGVEAEEAGLHIIAQKSEGCMRDALSMMDRISSFTNGHLTYEQAIEHLNVLDSGFYFKLQDALLTTNIAGTLLLLDEVYKRGFEGDAILNGFSQHLRDLLLCKDPKMTRLLDIPEAHKRAFFEKAQMLSMSYISSALNILNEAEVHYKTALNKRLHLEIAFIKLCYLPHVLQASSIQDAKKKSDKLANAIAIESKPKEHVVAQSVLSISNDDTAMYESLNKPSAAPVLEVAPEQVQIAPKQEKIVEAAVRENAAPPPMPKFGKDFLKKIQEQANAGNEQIEVQQLNQHLVEDLYNQYIDKLKNEADKQLQATNLALARVEANEDNLITIICSSNISHIYAAGNVEAFREFCKEQTNNTEIKVDAHIDPNAIKEDDTPKQMTKSEIFDLYASKNPLLRQLKNDLKLDLR